MAMFWKAAAAALIAVILSLALGKQEKDIGAILSMFVCCMIMVSALVYLEPVLEFLRELQEIGDLQGDFLGILLKALGIGLVTEIAATVCADAGNASLGKTLHTLGAAVILYISLPVFRSMLDLLRKILEEV